MKKEFPAKTTGNRLPAFDILRVILTLLVVNLHRETLTGAPQLFPNKYSWYAVPLFVILSFYLMSNYFSSTPPSFFSVVTRIKRFYVPFLFWSIAGFIVHPDSLSVRNVLFQFFTGSVVNVPLYYLLVIVVLTVIFWLLSAIPFISRLVVFLILLVAMFYLQYSEINYNYFKSLDSAIMYCYGRIAELLPYAVVGITVGILAPRKYSTVIVTALAVVSGIIFIANFNTPQPKGVDYSGILFFTGSLAVFAYFFLLKGIRFPKKVEKITSLLGLYSFGVYVSHYLLLELLLKYAPWTREINGQYPRLFLLGFLGLSFAFCIVLDKLTLRRFSYLVK